MLGHIRVWSRRLPFLLVYRLILFFLVGLSVLLFTVLSVRPAFGSTPTPTPPPAPTGWPERLFGGNTDIPTPVPEDALSCGDGVPVGWGTVTPGPDWLYYCSRCVDNALLPFSAATVTPTPVSGTPVPTPPGYQITAYDVTFGLPYYTELISSSGGCANEGAYLYCSGTVVYRSTSQYVTSGLSLQFHVSFAPAAYNLYLVGSYTDGSSNYTVDEVIGSAPPWYTLADFGYWFVEAGQDPVTVSYELYVYIGQVVTPTPTPTSQVWGSYCGVVQPDTGDASDWFAWPSLVLYPEGDCVQFGGFSILGYQLPGLRICFQEFEVTDPVFLGIRIPLQVALVLSVFMVLIKRF